MAYLDQILGMTEQTRKRVERGSRVGDIMELIKAKRATAPPTLQAAAQRKVAGSVNGHTLGDGHVHSPGLNAKLQDAFNRLAKDSGGKVKLNSGYRSVERQTQLWNEALRKYGSPEKARKWVAPPGKSNHNHGLAIDLGFADAATRAWVHKNAANYGIHFPLANEPWHAELIGTR